MDKKPKRLYRQHPEEPLEKELSISVKAVLLLFLLILIFGLIIFMIQPQTYGFF